MKYILIVLALSMTGIMSCKSSKESVSEEVITQSRSDGDNQRRGKGNVADRFNQMDANGDNMLTKNEVKGPLAESFDTVDTNGDGVITMEEMEAAPKPQRKSRGQRRN